MSVLSFFLRCILSWLIWDFIRMSGTECMFSMSKSWLELQWHCYRFMMQSEMGTYKCYVLRCSAIRKAQGPEGKYACRG